MRLLKREAVSNVKEKHKNAIILFYFMISLYNWSSSRNDIPENTVKTYLSRGREQLENWGLSNNGEKPLLEVYEKLKHPKRGKSIKAATIIVSSSFISPTLLGVVYNALNDVVGRSLQSQDLDYILESYL